MYKYIKLIVLLILLSSPFLVKSQCKNFAKNICKSQITPYIHDGNYNATTLTEGESAILYKTFNAGQQYRIYVCSDDKLPTIHFQVLDSDKNVIYDNRNSNYVKFYDFKLKSTQELIITVKPISKNKSADKIISGCVAVLIGFMN